MKRLGMMIPISAVLLTACGAKDSAPAEMQYIKTSVTYETISDMYANPDAYLGKPYHIVGTLYPSQDDDGETFYSVYAEASSGGHGIGLELDWEKGDGFEDYDTVTVEGILETETAVHDGSEIEYLILRVSMLEKRES